MLELIKTLCLDGIIWIRITNTSDIDKLYKIISQLNLSHLCSTKEQVIKYIHSQNAFYICFREVRSLTYEDESDIFNNTSSRWFITGRYEDIERHGFTIIDVSKVYKYLPLWKRI